MEENQNKKYGALETALRRVEDLAAMIGGLMMVVSMVMTSADALLRYTVGSPLTLAFYLNEKYLLVAMLSLPLAWGFRQGGYIRFVAILAALPKHVGDMLLRVGLIAGAIYVAMLGWFVGVRAFEAFAKNTVQMGIIDWPIGWSLVWVPIGLALLTVRVLVTALGDAEGLHSGEDSFGDEI